MSENNNEIKSQLLGLAGRSTSSLSWAAFLRAGFCRGCAEVDAHQTALESFLCDVHMAQHPMDPRFGLRVP